MKIIKLMLTCIAVVVLQQGFSQQLPEKAFVLEAQLTGMRTDSVFISYFTQDRYKLMTIPVVNQKFTVTGTIEAPELATLYFKNAGETLSRLQIEKRRLTFYLESKTMKLSGNPLNIKEMKITGSVTQTEFEELNKDLALVAAAKQPIYDAITAEKDHEKQAAIRDQLIPLDDKEKRIAYQFFLDHPHSYVTLDRMKYYIARMKLDSAKRMYSNLDSQLQATNSGKYLADEIKKMEAGVPGSIAAKFETVDINGKPLALANFKGKYVILDFWASWCVPCRKGNPHLISLFKQYHNKGLDIIGVSDDDRNIPAWKAAVEKDDVGIWDHVLRGLDMQLAMKHLPNSKDINEKYGIHSLPTKILIDPSGKIIGRYGDNIGDSEEELDKILASIFKS
jgi:thiol-disulfide isomerase/thioredoxin